MKKLNLDYKIVTKTYLEPSFLPTYVTVVTLMTGVTTKKIVTKTHFATKNIERKKVRLNIFKENCAPYF